MDEVFDGMLLGRSKMGKCSMVGFLMDEVFDGRLLWSK